MRSADNQLGDCSHIKSLALLTLLSGRRLCTMLSNSRATILEVKSHNSAMLPSCKIIVEWRSDKIGWEKLRATGGEKKRLRKIGKLVLQNRCAVSLVCWDMPNLYLSCSWQSCPMNPVSTPGSGSATIFPFTVSRCLARDPRDPFQHPLFERATAKAAPEMPKKNSHTFGTFDTPHQGCKYARRPVREIV